MAYFVNIQAADQFLCRLSIGCCLRNNILNSLRKTTAFVAIFGLLHSWCILSIHNGRIIFVIVKQGQSNVVKQNDVKQNVVKQKR